MIIAVRFNVNNERADDREILQEARKIIAEITKTKAEMNFIIRIFNRVQFEAVRSETGLNRVIRKIRITATD